jgi:hypothetical protein
MLNADRLKDPDTAYEIVVEPMPTLQVHDIPHVAVELGALQIVQTWTAVTTGANRKPLRLLSNDQYE